MTGVGKPLLFIKKWISYLATVWKSRGDEATQLNDRAYTIFIY